MSAFVLALVASPSEAAAIAATADDICGAAEDPCVINSLYDVTGDLDFGGRKVLFLPAGQLR